MGLADGLSRLPSCLIQRSFVKDSYGLLPSPSIKLCGQAGIDIETPCNVSFAVNWRAGRGLQRWAGGGEEWGSRVAIVLGEDMGSGGVGDERESLEVAAREIKRRKWRKWMDSGFYGGIIRVKLDGTGAMEELDLGWIEWKYLEQRARRYTMVEGRGTRLFWREVDGQLAFCMLEEELERVLRDLHDGHGHFMAGITAGRAHGKSCWPMRQKDIGRWIASCEPCQRMARIQRCGEIRRIMQFTPMDMVGMDFIGPINPPCEATGAVYHLLVVNYFSNFALGACLDKANPQSFSAILKGVVWLNDYKRTNTHDP